MSLWQKLSGRTYHADEFPVYITLIEAQLAAHIHLLEIMTARGLFSCWSYVTDGLRSHGQKEIIFTLRRDRGEKLEGYPHTPLDIFGVIYELTQQGRIVDVGDISEFRTDFLGYPALAYSPPQILAGVDVPFPVLIAIALTGEELQAVKAFGLTRVMARLGKAYRYYPCPPWTDRTRSSLSFKETLEKSILTRTNPIKGLGIRVCLMGDRLFLRLLPGTGKPLSDLLGQYPSNAGNVAITLWTELDPAANACLVWEPPQAEPFVIVPPGSDSSRRSGCFITFIPGLAEDGGRLGEDGFFMTLTEPSWLAILEAISLEKTITIPTTDGKCLALIIEWNANAYSTYRPAT